MSEADTVSLIDHAARMDDRWLFIAVLVILIVGGVIIIRLLFNQLENQRAAHSQLNERMAVALFQCAEIMGELKEFLTRTQKLLIFLLIPACLMTAGCGSTGRLPAGSYLEGRAGYSKDSGVTGKAILHIPLP